MHVLSFEAVILKVLFAVVVVISLAIISNLFELVPLEAPLNVRDIA